MKALRSFGIMVFSFWLMLGSSRAFAQDTESVPFSGDDLHYLGYVMLTGDTSAWANIESDDVFYFSRSLFFKAPALLKYLKNDDLYFLGEALIYGDKKELDKIVQDDFYYLGMAIFDKTESHLDNVKSDDVYYLGRGLIQKDMNYLDQISTKKTE